jgi:hypothetical protein
MAANSTNSNDSSFLTPLLAVVGTIAIFAFLVLLAYGLGGSDAPIEAVVENKPPSAATLRAKEKEVLTSYGWVDQDKGVVRIPVDVAQNLVVQELNQ